MEVMEGMSSPGKIPIEELRKSFASFVLGKTGEIVKSHQFGFLLGRMKLNSAENLLNKFEEFGKKKEKPVSPKPPVKRTRRQRDKQNSGSEENREEHSEGLKGPQRIRKRPNEIKDLIGKVNDKHKKGSVDKNQDKHNNADETGMKKDQDEESGSNDEDYEPAKDRYGIGKSNVVINKKLQQLMNPKKNDLRSSLPQFISVSDDDEDEEDEEIGGNNSTGGGEKEEEEEGGEGSDEDYDNEDDDDDPYFVPAENNNDLQIKEEDDVFGGEGYDQGIIEENTVENPNRNVNDLERNIPANIKNLRLSDFVNPEKIKHIRKKETIGQPKLTRQYQLALVLLTRLYGNPLHFDTLHSRLDRAGKSALAHFGESLLPFWPSPGAFAPPARGRNVSAGRRARETHIINMLRLLRICARLTTETLARTLAGDTTATIEVVLHLLSAMYEMLGMCNDERKWLENPVAARALKSNPVGKEDAFRKEDMEQLKKSNEKQKQMRELQRNAAGSFAGNSGADFSRSRGQGPTRGGFSNRGRGSFRGGRRIPWSANARRNEGRTRNNSQRDGYERWQRDGNGNYGREEGDNYHKNKTKRANNSRGRGGRGGSW
jgi:hypothetical protein